MGELATWGRLDSRSTPFPRIPTAVYRLPPALREIAAMVYRAGELSAPEIQERLTRPVSNSAIRTMLNRLVDKQILARKLNGNKYYYSPAKRLPHSEVQKLRRFCQEQFDGSLSQMAMGFAELLRRDEPQLATSMIHHLAATTEAVGHHE
jgi:predicted transcriptional regulator